MKRWLEALGAVAAVLATCGVLIGGVRWAVDPLREEVRTLRAETREDMRALRVEVRSDIGELRADVADIRERLVRVEDAVKRLEAVQEVRRQGTDPEASGTVGAAGG